MIANTLKTEFMTNPVGIDIKAPCLTWLCEGGLRQTAYEIRAHRDGMEVWNSGRVETDEMRSVFGAPLHSRDRVQWQVRLWDEKGEASAWSVAA